MAALREPEWELSMMQQERIESGTGAAAGGFVFVYVHEPAVLTRRTAFGHGGFG